MKKKIIVVSTVLLLVLAGYVGIGIKNSGIKGFFYDFYVENQEKKILKEIGRKIYSKKFNSLVKKLDINNLKTVNYLTDRDTLRIALNDKEYIKNMLKINSTEITVGEAEKILVTSRELVTLQELSPELKEYLKSEYRDFDYEYFATEGDKIISFIRDKEAFYSLLPNQLKELIKNINVQKVAKIRVVLGNLDISTNIEGTTSEFKKYKLTSEQMQKIYTLSNILYNIEEIAPEMREELIKLYPNIDYKLISAEGIFYLNDKKSKESISAEYMSKTYSYTSPYVKINPYNRVINSAIIKYPGCENDTVKVTIQGRAGTNPISYKIVKNAEIEILGLYLGEGANLVTINNGKREVKIPISIGNIPHELPSIVKNKVADNKNIKGNKMFYMTYLLNEEAYGVVIDSDGYTRYIFSPKDENRLIKGSIKKEKDKLVYFNKNKIIVFDIIGKVIESEPREVYESKYRELPKFTELLEEGYTSSIESDKTIITKPFFHDKYPQGQIVKKDMKTNETIDLFDIYFDYNNKNINSINSGIEIEFPY